MDLIKELTLSDVIYFDHIDYNLNAPWPLHAGPMSKAFRCVPKPAGKLMFTLNTIRDLNVQQPFAFPINFVGIPSAAGEPIVEWKVDQQIDKRFDVPVNVPLLSVHIWDVRGSVTTKLDSITPPQMGKGCAGENELFPVLLSSVGVNQLTVRGDVTSLGPAYTHYEDKTISINDIGVSAKGGRPPLVHVRISTFVDECGIADGVVPGGRVNFAANVTAPVAYTLEWSVSGHGAVAENGITDGAYLHVILGDTPGRVDITVVVTTEDGEIGEASIAYFPDTAATAFEKNLACWFRSRYRFKIPWVFPGDPARNAAVNPYSREELRDMQLFATRLLDATSQLLTLRDRPTRDRH
jgi:hypothetical protein